MRFNGRHAGYEVQMNSFSAPLEPSGLPKDFVSNMTVYDGGKPVLTKDVRVNDFLGYDNVDFYQQDAPRRGPRSKVAAGEHLKAVKHDERRRQRRRRRAGRGAARG